MKKYLIKIVCAVCAFCLIASSLCICIAADQDEVPMIVYKKGTNNASDAYKSSVYYNNLTSLIQSGDNVADLLAVALSQLGYSEGNSVDDFGGMAQGDANYTEYNYNMGSFGIGYGDNGEGGTYDWCASFVSFCLLQSGATTQNSMSDWCRNHVADENSAKYDAEYAKYVWREVSCQKWVDNLKAAELYRLSAFNQGDYVPKSGDLIFFRWSPTKNVGHIGIVVYADSERVYTVEGNTSAGSTMVSNGGGVYFKSYALDYECIDGYGVLPYENVLEQTSIDYSGNNATAGFYVTTADARMYFDKSLEGDFITIPAYTVIRVSRIVESGIDGLLRAEYSSSGERFEGYVVNSSSARLIQMTSALPEVVPESFLQYDKTDGYLSGEVLGYTLNGEGVEKEKIVVESIGRVVLSAEMNFESAILRGGYFIDGDREDIKWISDGITLDSESGAYKCDIWADIYGLSDGEHTLTFVLELDNDVVPIIDSLAITFYNEKQTIQEDIPESEPIETEQPTENATEGQTEPTEEESDGCGASVNACAFIAIMLIACGCAIKKKTE